MSASYLRRRGEVHQALPARPAARAALTRHFLLMSATPHNGKEEDFQLFMALLDGDRFEGRFRDGVHKADVVGHDAAADEGGAAQVRRHARSSRSAWPTPSAMQLSDARGGALQAVTDYVREEMNRADALQNDKRARHCRLRAADPPAAPRLIARGDLPVAATAARAAGETAARKTLIRAGRRRLEPRPGASDADGRRPRRSGRCARRRSRRCSRSRSSIRRRPRARSRELEIEIATLWRGLKSLALQVRCVRPGPQVDAASVAILQTMPAMFDAATAIGASWSSSPSTATRSNYLRTSDPHAARPSLRRS